jgi:dipeptidyl aminopeptidase/acylaminoacyl peptidase
VPRRASVAIALTALLGAIVVLPAAAQSGMDGKSRLTLDHYLQMQGVGGPVISPDGTRIVYTRNWIDSVNDSRESELWIMNADGTRKRKLVDGSGAVWSPDGTRIAYTAAGEPKGAQIWVRWMDAEGAASQITHVDESPGSITWAPDGTSIAFNMLVPSSRAWPIDMPSRPDGASWTASPRIVERAVYKRDRQGFIEEGHRHVYVVSADGGPVRQLSQGDYNYGAPSWSPDGGTMYFSGNLSEDWEHEWRQSAVYALDVATGATRQLTDRSGSESGPVVSPDGEWVAFTGIHLVEQTYIERQLYVMRADGTDMRSVTPELDRSPSGVRWSHDSTGLFFTVSREGTRNFWFVPADGGEPPVQVTEGSQMLTVTSVSDTGIAVALNSTPTQPVDIYSFNVQNPSAMTRLTHINENLMAGIKLGEVEEVWYKSTDDLDVQGWIVKPPDFDPSQQYPLMLAIHGGPHGMYNVAFNFGWQNHAANGYVVLYTNPRGSSGYGTEFGNAINRAYPDKDYDDLMNGVDRVIADGYVDEDNMYVYGCSGGGVLTAWVVGHTDRFAAASSNCPVINWLSFVGTTDGISWYKNFDNYPWDDPSEHLRRSPLMYIGNVTTPTMLMTGVNDLRTPISQTEEFYSALQVMRVPTAMIRFNDEWHGTSSKPSNYLRTQLYLRHWFERYMTDDALPKRLKKAQSATTETTAARE